MCPVDVYILPRCVREQTGGGYTGTWCALLMFIFYFIKVCKGADGGATQEPGVPC